MHTPGISTRPRTGGSLTDEQLLQWMLRKTERQENGCLHWQGKLRKGGYGRIRYNGKEATAHRLVYELIYGKLPRHLVVRHTCDNPKCIAPGHLLSGTIQDNNRDMHERRRNFRKLSDEAVADIKARLRNGEGKFDIAYDHGVSEENIRAIAIGKTWKHIC